MADAEERRRRKNREEKEKGDEMSGPLLVDINTAAMPAARLSLVLLCAQATARLTGLHRRTLHCCGDTQSDKDTVSTL